MSQFDLPRRLVAETLGTALLLATVVGSGIMAENLAGGNVAIALLGNTIPTGAILVVLITIFGPVSGAHFNPAVTLSFLIRREITLGAAVAYVVVQIIGGIIGTWSAHLMFAQEIFQLSSHVRTGGAQWFSEGVATFGLVLTWLACTSQLLTGLPLQHRSPIRPSLSPVALPILLVASILHMHPVSYWLRLLVR